MNSSLKIFRINIGFLINQPIGYSRVIPINFDHVEISGGIFLNNVEGSIALSRMQNGIRAQASFKGEMENECGRCLASFIDTIQTEFEELFLFPNMEATEYEMKIPEDGNIDFEPLFLDYMGMELSINPLCKPDCKGLCDICGQDLNQAICIHKQKKNNTLVTETSETSNHNKKSVLGSSKT